MKFRRELVGSTTATLILSVLNSGSAHGYEIVRRINELSDGIFEWQEGTIYPALHKLEGEGAYSRTMGGSFKRKNEARLFLTDDGKRTLIADAKEWTVYSKAVEHPGGVLCVILSPQSRRIALKISPPDSAWVRILSQRFPGTATHFYSGMSVQKRNRGSFAGFV